MKMIESKDIIQRALQVAGADRDKGSGGYILWGRTPVSLFDGGSWVGIDETVNYSVGGVKHPLAKLLTASIGESVLSPN